MARCLMDARSASTWPGTDDQRKPSAGVAMTLAAIVVMDGDIHPITEDEEEGVIVVAVEAQTATTADVVDQVAGPRLRMSVGRHDRGLAPHTGHQPAADHQPAAVPAAVPVVHLGLCLGLSLLLAYQEVVATPALHLDHPHLIIDAVAPTTDPRHPRHNAADTATHARHRDRPRDHRRNHHRQTTCSRYTGTCGIGWSKLLPILLSLLVHIRGCMCISWSGTCLLCSFSSNTTWWFRPVRYKLVHVERGDVYECRLPSSQWDFQSFAVPIVTLVCMWYLLQCPVAYLFLFPGAPNPYRSVGAAL